MAGAIRQISKPNSSALAFNRAAKGLPRAKLERGLGAVMTRALHLQPKASQRFVDSAHKEKAGVTRRPRVHIRWISSKRLRVIVSAAAEIAAAAVVISVLLGVLILVLVLQDILRVLPGRIGRGSVVIIDGFALPQPAGRTAAEQAAAASVTAEQTANRVPKQYAAGYAGRSLQRALKEPAALRRRGLSTAPRAGLRRRRRIRRPLLRRITLRRTWIPLVSAGVIRPTGRAGRGRLRTPENTSTEITEEASFFVSGPAFDLRVQFRNALGGGFQRLLLDEYCLRQNIACRGAASYRVADERLGFGVFRAVRRAANALEKAGEHLPFVGGHVQSPNRGLRRPAVEYGRDIHPRQEVCCV